MVDCGIGVQDGQEMALILHPAEWDGGSQSARTIGIENAPKLRGW